MWRSEIYSYHAVIQLSRKLCFTSSGISHTLQSGLIDVTFGSQLCERLKPRDPACLGAELRPQESEIRCRAMGRYARVICRVGHRGLGNGQRGQVGLLFSNDGNGGKLAAVCKYQAMQEHGWCGCKIACKLDLHTRCRYMVSFMFWHSYSQVLFEKDLWGLQNRSGRDDAHRNPSPCRDPNLVCPARTKLSFL